MDIKAEVKKIGEHAKEAARELVKLSTGQKNLILDAWADEIEAKREFLREQNAKDLDAGRAAGISSALLDRLTLSDKVISAIVEGLRQVAQLNDPVGQVLDEFKRPNGITIRKIRVPIGVIAMIYEARPNVTVDAAALCFKTSNAVILRGGKEAIHSNLALANILQEVGVKNGMPKNAVQVIPFTDREAVSELVQLDELVDLAIPRGGEGLIRAVMKDARVPVIKHYKGNCTIFIDSSARRDRITPIVINAKCQRPGVCNAIEHLLVHEELIKTVVPELIAELQKAGVEVRGDEEICKADSSVKLAGEAEWYEEYLGLVIGIKVVKSVSEAIDHINKYGSHHSDAILSEDKKAIEMFFRDVDSAAVYANASTRFTDGGEFGFGAEIGISTDKIHARGPMALPELTSYKYVIMGAGQVRE